MEDFTGLGLPDLRAGLIRTPLSPRQTLLDDPLRALRAVRFAARLGFHMVDDLCSALSSPEIEAALLTKISRERVGTELQGPRLLPSLLPVHSLSQPRLSSFRSTILSPYSRSVPFDLEGIVGSRIHVRSGGG